jgi:hypothetical protein
MLKAQLLCIAVFFSLECISQGFINTDRKTSRKYLNAYTIEEKVKTSITETDSTIVFLVRDTSVQNLDIILHYDNAGRCFKEYKKLTCDSCLNKILTQTLNYKRYKWSRVSDTEYISKFSRKVLLTKNTGAHYSFTIHRFAMSKQEYKDLLKKVK